MLQVCRKRKQCQREDILQEVRQHLSELHATWVQLDKETQYQIAKASAEQVGRTDEAFIQELLPQVM